ncbi:MAG: response regulator [Methyloligellaceae bacterium]
MKLAEILVVDDCDIDLKIVEYQMSRENMKFNLHTAINGQAAIDFLNSDENPGIDIIFLDLNMPFMDGFSFLEYRKNNELPNCPIAICTSSTYYEDMDKAYALGATDYMEKPPSKANIKKLIEKIETVYWEEYDGELRILKAS